MAVRKIVRIDEARCTGCGQCVPACAEGALRIVDGKARLLSDNYCDGLGACLGVCPEGAITVIERDAEEFDEHAAAERQQALTAPSQGGVSVQCACPGMAPMDLGPPAARLARATGDSASELTHWPVQLALVPVRAPFFDGADLLLAADCVPFALAGFHGRLLRGRKLLVACPKLDNASTHAEKLARILKENDVWSLTVAHMEVPCCFGLMALAERAVAASGRSLPIEEVTISVQGQIKDPARRPGLACAVRDR